MISQAESEKNIPSFIKAVYDGKIGNYQTIHFESYEGVLEFEDHTKIMVTLQELEIINYLNLVEGIEMKPNIGSGFLFSTFVPFVTPAGKKIISAR
ncbi:hypothetical protein [Lentilactobacillus hilgardii]|uniref:hypothetical protein n=1 Tax=Lentilactobacillus hilgardii TaxID=1588 RepID=UPI00019C4C15|nr:hypothetical protein [Lentilactobacillus hilgardii]EEI21201.1 hypothetical protein HMPREF0497_0003 [Lentilactobacillus buchneri ATCC 11577]MCT3396634.1 hypothetical protein [Lentilactobacillus hilgardii]